MRAGLIVALVVLLVVGAGWLPDARADGPYVGYPDSMAALGDSITQAADTTSYADHPEDSWATGTNASVNSLYSRLLAVNPGIAGNRFNDAVSGARMTHLNGQAQSAVAQGAELVVILMGANDICTTNADNMLLVETFQTQFETAMQTLAAGLPNARIAVASIPDVYNLWDILHNDSNAQFIWNFGSICQSLLANPTSMATDDVQRRAKVRQWNMDFDDVLHDVCGQYIHCKFDNYTGFNTAFTPAHVSTLDYFHPSIAGQALAAQLGWDNTYDFSDVTPPASDSSGLPSPGGATVTLTATDGAGVSGIEYKVNGGAYLRYTAPLVLSEGTQLTWRAVDVNGNTEATHTCRIAFWGWMPGDDDCDGFTTANENLIGTDPNSQCAVNSGAHNEPEPDRWPADFDDNQIATTLDLVVYVTALNKSSGDSAYVLRADLNGNGLINTLDLVPYVTVLNKRCAQA